jgi:hypothetical protein
VWIWVCEEQYAFLSLECRLSFPGSLTAGPEAKLKSYLPLRYLLPLTALPCPHCYLSATGVFLIYIIQMAHFGPFH